MSGSPASDSTSTPWETCPSVRSSNKRTHTNTHAPYSHTPDTHNTYKYQWRIQRGVRDVYPHSRSKFFYFHAILGKFLQNNGLCASFGSRRPHGKSWIHHWIHTNKHTHTHTHTHTEARYQGKSESIDVLNRYAFYWYNSIVKGVGNCREATFKVSSKSWTDILNKKNYWTMLAKKKK